MFRPRAAIDQTTSSKRLGSGICGQISAPPVSGWLVWLAGVSAGELAAALAA